MASKNKERLIEQQLRKILAQDPEIKEQQKDQIIISHMASTLTIVIDWMIQKFDATPAQCEELMDYFLSQLAEVGKIGWDSFFEDVDKLIKEDVGFTPIQYIQDHVRWDNGEDTVHQ